MKIANTIFAIILLLLLLVFMYSTLQIPKPINPNVIGPAYVPFVYLTFGIILSIFIIIFEVKDLYHLSQVKINLRLFLYIFIAIAYMFTINWVGYYLSSLIVIVLLYLLLGIRKWYQLIAIPLCYNLFVFLIFEKIISLPIP